MLVFRFVTVTSPLHLREKFQRYPNVLRFEYYKTSIPPGISVANFCQLLSNFRVLEIPSFYFFFYFYLWRIAV